MFTIAIQEDLRRLAGVFAQAGTPLYIVGGAVRDAFLNVPVSDIDICAPVLPETAAQYARQCGFAVNEESARLGTLSLTKTHRYEYTAFRQDSYAQVHRPKEVAFTTDITLDALRRDFTVNAMYYNIANNTLVDPLSGQADLQRRILRQCKLGVTMAQDGLRILRLFRFAAQLGFTMEAGTLSSAVENKKLLAFIAPERIREELLKLLLYKNVQPLIDEMAQTGILAHVLFCKGARACTLRTEEPTTRLAELMLANGVDRCAQLRLSRTETTHIRAIIAAVQNVPTTKEPLAWALAQLGKKTAGDVVTILHNDAYTKVYCRLLARNAPFSLQQAQLFAAEVMHCYGLQPGKAVGEKLRCLWKQAVMQHFL